MSAGKDELGVSRDDEFGVVPEAAEGGVAPVLEPANAEPGALPNEAVATLLKGWGLCERLWGGERELGLLELATFSYLDPSRQDCPFLASS